MRFQAFRSRSKYYDTNYYPHGFSRSGEFTRAEAELLENCGAVIRDLAEARRAPDCAEHHAMLAVVNGECAPQSALEKLWCKYKNSVRERKSFLTCSLRPMSKSKMVAEDAQV